MNAIAVDPHADEGVEKVETVRRAGVVWWWTVGDAWGSYEPHHSLEALEIGFDLERGRVRH